MKLNFKNTNDLCEGIASVQGILGFEFSENAKIIVTAKKNEDESVLNVRLAGNEAIIEYGAKANFFRGLMLLCKNVNSDFEISEKRNFRSNGAMFDLVETCREQFISGDLDVNDDAVWAKYVADLEASGLQEYLDLYNEFRNQG